MDSKENTKNWRYVFVGNRVSVLNEMLKLRVNIIKVFVMEVGSLARTIHNFDVNYEIITSKDNLINELAKLDYDALISNGCQYILPIAELKEATYINVHPSYLPDLKGRDPIIGAVLFQKDTGVTCHIMNDEIDSGDIISQIEIPYSSHFDSALLYQICFLFEAKCFREALERNFQTIRYQIPQSEDVYYTMKFKDRILNFNQSNSDFVNQIKAFNTESKGCFFRSKKETFRVFDADILNDVLLLEYHRSVEDFIIILEYERRIIFKKDKQLIRFNKLEGNISTLRIGDLISEYKD